MKRPILLVGFFPAWLMAYPLRLFGKKDTTKLRWWTLGYWTVFGPESAFIFGMSFWFVIATLLIIKIYHS